MDAYHSHYRREVHIVTQEAREISEERRGNLKRQSHCKKRTTINQLLAVDAKVTVTPLVKHGKPLISSMKAKVQPSWDDEKEISSDPDRFSNGCTFTVTQVLCVRVPLSFGVVVDVDDGRVHCSPPQVGPCTVSPRKYKRKKPVGRGK